MKRLFKFKYPKLSILVLAILLAYFIFSNNFVQTKINSFATGTSYLYVIIFGMFFSFGFTTPFSTGFFLTYNAQNIFISAILGGAGAVLADLTIFKLIKFSFMDEFNRLKKEKEIIRLSNLFDLKLSHRIKIYFTYAFVGVIIASPLPDEIGVGMLAGLTKIKAWQIAIIGFVFNTLGILVLLSI